MTSYPYQHVLNEMFARIQHLSFEEQLILIAKLEVLVRTQAKVKPLRSILELEGLGTEIWKDVDINDNKH